MNFYIKSMSELFGDCIDTCFAGFKTPWNFVTIQRKGTEFRSLAGQSIVHLASTNTSTQTTLDFMPSHKSKWCYLVLFTHAPQPVSAPYPTANGYNSMHISKQLETKNRQIAHLGSLFPISEKAIHGQGVSHLSTLHDTQCGSPKCIKTQTKKVLKLCDLLEPCPYFHYLFPIAVETIRKSHANNSSNLNTFGFSLLALYCPFALWQNDFGCFHFSLE